MLKNLIFFARFFLFWLLFFLLDRLIFLAVNFTDIKSAPITEVLAATYHGLRLDLSMTAYIAVVPLLFYTGYVLIVKEKNIPFKWLINYNKALIILFSIIGMANINIYREWGSKINAKALGFAISSPNEA
ncbi:MAG: sulfatase, partial [Pedobacter sp.]|nr:sulfatase [Pedobacter sp.]